jgi:amidase
MRNQSGPRSRVLPNFIAAGALAAVFAGVAASPARADPEGAPTKFNEMTVAQMQAAMAAGKLSSVELTRFYIERILKLDQNGPGVNAVIEINPDAIAMAQRADEMRENGKVLGPLHGIPVLLKDNIDTGDKMQTTAGSFALFGTPPARDSTVAANLRKGGAVILGKTNLSEWANFRSFESVSGWSGRGGQTNNPYGINRNPCGSSSGSGAAATANFAAVSLGSETDGSIVCPANVNGVVGIKPTVGLTSRGAHLAYPGHHRPARTDRGRRCDGARRHPEPHLRRARSRHRRRSARVAGHRQDAPLSPFGLTNCV